MREKGNHFPYSPLSADVLPIFTTFPAIFFLNTVLGTQTCIFEISQFSSFAFIENFQHSFPETSVEIINADF